MLPFFFLRESPPQNDEQRAQLHAVRSLIGKFVRVNPKFELLLFSEKIGSSIEQKAEVDPTNQGPVP